MHDNYDHLPKTVREYRKKHKRGSRLGGDSSETLDMVHRDLEKLSQGGRHGRQGDPTSETILRDVDDLGLIEPCLANDGVSVQGSIKRALRLARCFYRGFKTFAAAIGLEVSWHSLIVSLSDENSREGLASEVPKRENIASNRFLNRKPADLNCFHPAKQDFVIPGIPQCLAPAATPGLAAA